MQAVGAQVKLAEYKPQPTDGKVFVKSEPAGAAIILVTADGGKMDTGKKTPTMVQVPIGKQTLELQVKAYKHGTLTVDVDGKNIAKPDAVTLAPVTVPVDIVFEDGWSVFLDGRRVRKVRTPCTVELPLGQHTIVLAKEGFNDVSQRLDVREGAAFRTISKPSRGASQVLTLEAAMDTHPEWAVGKYTAVHQGWPWPSLTKELAEDGRLLGGNGEAEGTWEIKNRFTLTLKWNQWAPEVLEFKDGVFRCKTKHFTMTPIANTEATGPKTPAQQ